MEPNKMEKDFKEKLEQRTIQPSDMAWDRLDAMLSVAENKKPKKNRTWMYMAAAFLVFLLVGVLFLNQEKENSGIDNNSSVVSTEGEQLGTATESSEIFATPVTNQEAVAVQSQSTNRGSNKISGSKKDNSIKVTNGQPVAQEALAANDKNSPSTIVQPNDTEKLLAATVPAETAKKKRGVKVDPNALLSAAEEELDDSFKDKVLIGAVKNFDAVRSAVANRNYE